MIAHVLNAVQRETHVSDVDAGEETCDSVVVSSDAFVANVDLKQAVSALNGRFCQRTVAASWC